MEPYTHYCIHYIHTPWRIIDFTLSELGNDHSYITEIKPNQRYEREYLGILIVRVRVTTVIRDITMINSRSENAFITVYSKITELSVK